MNNVFVSLQKKIIQFKRNFWDYFFCYIGTISLKTRSYLQKIMKEVVTCGKLHVIFMKQNKLLNIFASETLFPKFLSISYFYKFLCWPYYRGCVRHFAERSGEYVSIEAISNERVERRIENAVWHNLFKFHSLLKIVVFSVTIINSTS